MGECVVGQRYCKWFLVVGWEGYVTKDFIHYMGGRGGGQQGKLQLFTV
jgi:hypothetical protein